MLQPYNFASSQFADVVDFDPDMLIPFLHLMVGSQGNCGRAVSGKKSRGHVSLGCHR